MNKYLLDNTNSNYDKFPVIQVSGEEQSCVVGWENITSKLRSLLQQQNKKILIIECYQGVYDNEVLEAIQTRFPKACIFKTASVMKEQNILYNAIKEDVTDDEIFGYMTRYTMDVYFDTDKVEGMRELIATSSAEYVIVYGVGASYIWQNDSVIAYLDMARWEIQLRFRRNEVSNVGFENATQRTSLQYKQAFFVDWRICDRWKKQIMRQIDVFIDTNKAGEPKMVSAAALFKGLDIAASRPFRVVPYFDQGPWGGQWMKEICDLDREAVNYAWCFDCVPEENSLYLGFGDIYFEIPSIDLVFTHPVQLLGPNVYGRFGDEFPIRFDFLDTMEGGNLSLQVHPLVEYIQEKFGMHYTQEESYYILDAKEDAKVYLGVKEGTNPEDMISELRQAQKSGVFDAEKYVGIYPVKNTIMY